MFTGLTSPTFDPLSAATTAADMAVRLLLRPERTARLVDFHRRDPSLPGLEEVIKGLEDKTFGGTPRRHHGWPRSAVPSNGWWCGG